MISASLFIFHLKPESNIYVSELQDGSSLNERHMSGCRWATAYPANDFGWCLMAQAPAITECHVDGGGYCTYVSPVIGEKLWFVASGQPLTVGKKGYLPNRLEWTAVHLKAHDDL